jgi:hypothetical protein
MKSISFRFGRFRITVRRPVSGGLCPLNVIGKTWSLIPRTTDDLEEPAREIDFSPAGIGALLLSDLRRVLERKRNS